MQLLEKAEAAKKLKAAKDAEAAATQKLLADKDAELQKSYKEQERLFLVRNTSS